MQSWSKIRSLYPYACPPFRSCPSSHYLVVYQCLPHPTESVNYSPTHKHAAELNSIKWETNLNVIMCTNGPTRGADPTTSETRGNPWRWMWCVDEESCFIFQHFQTLFSFSKKFISYHMQATQEGFRMKLGQVCRTSPKCKEMVRKIPLPPLLKPKWKCGEIFSQ